MAQALVATPSDLPSRARDLGPPTHGPVGLNQAGWEPRPGVSEMTNAVLTPLGYEDGFRRGLVWAAEAPVSELQELVESTRTPRVDHDPGS